jgi:DNA repair protein RecO (recombination protein O)
VPLHTADALVLRTYKLGEADRIVVFLTRDRGKKRGVAQGARRAKSRFQGALEPLTEVRVAYFESERRELVSLNYAEVVRTPLGTADLEALGYSHYFAELIDAWAAEADADERLFRLGCSVLDAMAAGFAGEALARYFECWLLRLQGVYPTDLSLSPGAVAFVQATRQASPGEAARLGVTPAVLRELERKHQAVITAHLEKDLKSVRVMNELRRRI